MARIQGVDIPPNKRVEISLTYIYGIGFKTALDVCNEAGIDPAIKARDLSDDEVSRLSSIIESNCVVEGQLRRVIQQNIGRLKDIACYRGLRHRRGLPVRGQNTRNNSRTRKGPKRLVAKKKK
ncbi:MAG TPA: 30S ribosomal protein S13 [Planctomycetes bacterium]|nr:30S ribosomal protein S13 [Planctomycetota bacterium]HIN80067.1 30S ribosomal protein S13 [Planctomycetota bacterium]